MRGLAVSTFCGLLAVLVGMLVIDYHAERPEDHPLPPPAPIARTIGTARSASVAEATARAASVTEATARAGSVAEADTQGRVDRILARPLFNASRRPGAVVAGTESGPAALPRLSAVVVSNRGRTVIFAGSGTGKPVTVAEGGRIGAYVVQSIGAGQVTVVGPEGPRVLRPLFDAGSGPAGTAGGTVATVAPAPSILDLFRQPSAPVTLPGLPNPAAPR